jgi:N-acetylmuramic acid 6-phosphate etherase
MSSGAPSSPPPGRVDAASAAASTQGPGTERPSEDHPALDQYAVVRLVDAFVDDQAEAATAVRRASASIARAVEAAVPRIAAGGRLVYVGAGTSGRLGVLDSVELYPTFSWPKDRAVALLAGGRQAMFESVEGAEDAMEQGRLDVAAVVPTPLDVVILVSASGATAYVMGALEAARAAGALTIGIANNPAAPVTLGAALAITLDTGSEVISGSTRLKAGTSQKIALNTLSSAVMVRLHKVYGNLMVDLQPTNAKLFRRALSLTVRATGADEDSARAALAASGYRVKVAIVSILKKIDVAEAQARLAATRGSVRAAIAS